jgi:hypothetical protein
MAQYTNCITLNRFIGSKIQTIIFVGDVPHDVKTVLQKIQDTFSYNKGDAVILKNFYGDEWLPLLKLDRFKKSAKAKQPTKKGGEEGEERIAVDEQTENEDQNEFIFDVKEIKETEEIPKGPTYTTENRLFERKDKEFSTKELVFIFDICLFPEDTMAEFKLKIFAITGIPPYRQHLYFEYEDKIFPVSYTISYVQDFVSKIYSPDIREIVKNASGKLDTTSKIKQIYNIPINLSTYEKLKDIKIVNNDSFTTFDTYYYKYATIGYNIVDIADYIKNPLELFNNLKSDKYQSDVIYYSFVMIYWPMFTLPDVFLEYLKSEEGMCTYYPALCPSRKHQITKFELEAKILNLRYNLYSSLNNKGDVKPIEENIIVCLTSANINIVQFKKDIMNKEILNIRNLFDFFELNSTVDACICKVIKDGLFITLNKTYKGSKEISGNVPYNVILFRINVNDKGFTNHIFLRIHISGNYTIKSFWKEENRYSFNDVAEIVMLNINMILTKINSLKSKIFYNNTDLIEYIEEDGSNMKFNDVDMSIIYNKAIHSYEFYSLKQKVMDYEKAGIVRKKDVKTKNELEFYFSKGMFQHNPNRLDIIADVKNNYSYLTNGGVARKWHDLYERTRVTSFVKRATNLKISISSIKEKEFLSFYQLIITLIYQTGISKQKDKKQMNKDKNENDTEKTHEHSRIGILKERDPALYKFEKLYGGDALYSIICQKNFQPLLFTEEEYNELPKEKKKKVIKYWNFTLNKDAYYLCPNRNYPNIRFIVGKHPLGYCIPCCRRFDVTKSKRKGKEKEYVTCLKEHVYKKEPKKSKEEKSKSYYVSQYGKDIDLDRISNIPNALKELFSSNVLSKTIKRCVKFKQQEYKEKKGRKEIEENVDYFIYGTEQNAKYAKNIGLLFSISNAIKFQRGAFKQTNKEAIDTIIDSFIIQLKQIENISYLTSSFTTKEEIMDKFETIKGIKEIEGINDFEDFIISDTNNYWNSIFIAFSRLFLNINIIIIEDKMTPYTTYEDLQLILPVENKSLTVANCKNLVLLKRHQKYFPIYQIKTSTVFSMLNVRKTLFDNDDDIIKSLKMIVNADIMTKITSSDLNLETLEKMISIESIKKLYINEKNLCYAVLILFKKHELIVPVQFSSFLWLENIHVDYSYPDYEINSFQNILDFINFSKFPIDKFIAYKSKIIGIISNNMNFYMKEIEINEIQQNWQQNKIEIFDMKYNPHEIASIIHKKINPEKDDRTNNLANNFFETYAFHFLVIEFSYYFNNERDYEMRKRLLDIFEREGTINVLKKINSLDISQNDKDLIVQQYQEKKSESGEYVFEMITKIIESSVYEFDRKTLMKIKAEKKKDKIIKMLNDITKEIIYVEDNISEMIDNNAFETQLPNIISPCAEVKTEDNMNENKVQMQCKNKKLIFTRKNLDIYLDILAADIQNIFKNPIIFSNNYIDRYFDFFRFIYRKNEKITVDYT